MKRTIIQLSEEQLEYIIDSFPPPLESESSLVANLRERLTQALSDLRADKPSSVSDFE